MTIASFKNEHSVPRLPVKPLDSDLERLKTEFLAKGNTIQVMRPCNTLQRQFKALSD